MIDVVYNPNGVWTEIQEALILLTMLVALFLGITLLAKHPKIEKLQLLLVVVLFVGLITTPFLSTRMTLGHLKTVDATKYETYITSDGDTPVLRITSKNKEIPTDNLMFRIHTEHVVTLTNQLQVRQNNPDTIDVQVQKPYLRCQVHAPSGLAIQWINHKSTIRTNKKNRNFGSFILFVFFFL